jgi:glycosyltransferase involved in cell wall biosynthesis
MIQSEKPMVSVLMTTYNREKYLEQAVRSVLASTYEDFELIIVDDQSKDKSLAIARELAGQDSRIRVILNEKNLGDYPNRNKAAGLARGKYLKYVDADDLIYPTGLQVLVNGMEQHPEAGFGLCSLPQDKFRVFPIVLSPEEAYKRHYFQEQLFHKAPLSAIMRKEAFDAVNGFTGRRYLGDFEMWHILASRFPVVLMPHGVVWYREHEEQEMQNNRTDFTIPFKYLLCAEEMINRAECPLSASDREKALRKIHWNQARYIMGVGKNHSRKIMSELKRQTSFSYIQLFMLAIRKPN